jgi:hypothetical protein
MTTLVNVARYHLADRRAHHHAPRDPLAGICARAAVPARATQNAPCSTYAPEFFTCPEKAAGLTLNEAAYVSS